MASWRTLLSLLFLASLVAFEERVSVPSCVPLDGSAAADDRPENLKVMIVADLHLLGPDGRLSDLYFRDSYTTKFLRKSFAKVKPDMLVVLGDISANGSDLTNSKWLGLLRQFRSMLGPFLGLPLHIVLGDRDIGDCKKLDPESVSQIASNLPGLDSAGCGAFDISNVSFVSLNAVAMLCGNNAVRFHVETAIERESVDIRGKVEGAMGEGGTERLGDFRWRENHVPSGSGPVLLLHFPLHHQMTWGKHGVQGAVERNIQSNHHMNHENLWEIDDCGGVGSAPYNLADTLPINASEYIFQALKPRVVFSAHSHHFLDHTHRDGTREVTVPAMTWAARDDPGFVVATFSQNRAVIVSRCFLARESHVLMAYFTFLSLLLAITLI